MTTWLIPWWIRRTAARRVSRSSNAGARTSSSPRCAITAPIRRAPRSARSARRSSRPTAWCWWIRTYCVGCRYCIQACPYGCRFLNPKTQTAEKCTLCYHRITKGLTTACCEACPTGARQLADLKNPEGSDSRVFEDSQRAGAEAAPGHGREALLQRPGRFGAIGGAKRCRFEGFMYPNEVELAVEHPDRPVPVRHGPGGGRIHSGVARARLPRRGREAHLSAGVADRASVSAGGAAAAATASGTSRALVRNVPDARTGLRPWPCSASSICGT